MTYCVGMLLEKGMAFMSDTRTNSGVDNISTFRKMFSWSVPGERFITMMTAGNLATTQALISQLEERNKAPAERHNSLLEAPTMFQVANIIGTTLRDTIAAQGQATLHLDLLPDHDAARVMAEVSHPRGSRSLTTHLQSRLGLKGIKAGLLREALSARHAAVIAPVGDSRACCSRILCALDDRIGLECADHEQQSRRRRCDPDRSWHRLCRRF